MWGRGGTECRSHSGAGKQVRSERGGPARRFPPQRRAGQQQHQHAAERRGPQGRLARLGPLAAAQLGLAAGLLAQQARVGGGTAAAVAHTLPAVLAAQEFVVTHPGCGEKDVSRGEEKGQNIVRTSNGRHFT